MLLRDCKKYMSQNICLQIQGYRLQGLQRKGHDINVCNYNSVRMMARSYSISHHLATWKLTNKVLYSEGQKKVVAISALATIFINSHEPKREVEFGCILLRTSGDSFHRTFVIRFLIRGDKTIMCPSKMARVTVLVP